MRVLFVVVLLFFAFFLPKSLVNFLSHFYELYFRIRHYGYEEIDNKNYERKLGFGKKLLCSKEYFCDEMQAFLSDENRTGTFLSSHSGKRTEQVTIGGMPFIVKTHKYDGFWQNLFVQGRGVEIWNNAHLARRQGLQTLKPVALIEEKKWNSSTSVVVYLMEGESKDAISLATLDKLVKKMRGLRFLMRDFSVENIIFLEGDIPELIDIGRLFQYPKCSLIYPMALSSQIERHHHAALYTFCLWDLLMHEMANLYQKCWPLFHYTYAAIDRPDYVKKISYKEKLLCKQEYDTPAMRGFLQSEYSPPRGLMSVHEGHITERVEIDGKAFIVKTTETRGFLQNLLSMNIGVKIWNNAHFAKERGLPTLTPVALLEKRSLHNSQGIVVYLMEGSILKDAMDQRGDLTPAINTIVQKMADLHIIHAEFRPLNALYLEDGRVQLVDIDGLHSYPKYSYLFKKRLSIEVERFNKKARLNG